MDDETYKRTLYRIINCRGFNLFPILVNLMQHSPLTNRLTSSRETQESSANLPALLNHPSFETMGLRELEESG